MSAATARPVAGVLDDVAEQLERVFAALAALGQRFATVVAAAPDAPRLDDVASLRPAILDLLARHRPLVAGAGLIVVPDLLADAPRWLEWWWATGRGAPEPLRVNLDPTAPDFYDYTTADWYATPRRTGAPRLAGPYVDHSCTNEYAVTLSSPVLLDGRLLGVAAADVLVSSIERWVLPALLALDRPTALANADGRVIASNSADLLPGQRLELDDGARPDAGGTPIGTWLLMQSPC